MLPERLFNSYKRYKANTAEVLTWLVANSPVSADVVEQPIDIKAPRLKGKARRAGKETTAVKKYFLKVGQIISLARGFHTSDTPTDQVPARIIRLLQKAIRLRRRCTVWYRKQSGNQAQTQQSLSGHEYFITVLERVLEILGQYSATALSDNATVSEVANDKEQSTPSPLASQNAFDYLDAEDHQSEDEAGPQLDNSQTTDQDAGSNIETPPNVYEVEDSSEDLTFMVFCMIADLEQLRLFIRQTWEKYRDHKISLMNASTCTNVAIHFARGVEEQFMVSFPQYFDWSHVLAAIFPTFTRRHGLLPDQYPNRISSEQIASLNSIYWIPFQLLSRLNDPMSSSPPTPLRNESYDPSADLSTLSAQDLHHRDRIILTQIIFEYLPVLMWKLPTRDEITIGLIALMKTKKLNIWLVFAFQIFLDIHHSLGGDLSRGLQDFKTNGASIKSAIDRFLQTEKETGLNLDEYSVACLRARSEWIGEEVLKDIGPKLRGPGFLLGGPREHFCTKPFFFLSQHPLMCGTLLFRLTLDVQTIGLLVINRMGTSIAAPHLYNAARQTKHMSVAWPAIDRLIATWTPEKFFIGAMPSDPKGYRNRYLLMTGVSPAHFASDHQSRRHNKSKKDPKVAYVKSIKDCKLPCEYPPLMEKFLEWLGKGKEQPKISADHIEALLKGLLDSKRQGSRTGSAIASAMSPVKMLDLLHDAFAREEPLMLLDYFGIHRAILEVLYKVEAAIHQRLMRWYNNTHKTKKGGPKTVELLWTVPDCIFESYHHKDVDIKRVGEEMLATAGEIMEGIVKRDLLKESGQLIKTGVEEQPSPLELGPACLWGILQSS